MYINLAILVYAVIGRMARAIYELRERRNFPPDGHVKWSEAPQSVRDYNHDLARATLLAAMRPDEAMIEAGNRYIDEGGRDAGGIFRAMLKRALEEK